MQTHIATPTTTKVSFADKLFALSAAKRQMQIVRDLMSARPDVSQRDLPRTHRQTARRRAVRAGNVAGRRRRLNRQRQRRSPVRIDRAAPEKFVDGDVELVRNAAQTFERRLTFAALIVRHAALGRPDQCGEAFL